jgi:tyrosyl-tRNA synthetase
VVVTHILDDLRWRGLIQDSTGLDELRKDMDAGPVTFYVGFDPTAASLHLGHLTQALTARRLQLAGHKPLALVGGATGQIGDPKESGERTLNDPSVTAGWVTRIRAQLEPFFDFDGPAAATMVNNLDWTAPMSAIEFLRDVGKHFPVNKMLARDIVRNRLETGISFTEFAYQLLQSHDYYELNQRYGCTLQFGGSDQWGNITAGVDYIRRRGAGPVHAFTTPLVTKADGTKFGKTESGTVWLDAELTSPYAFFQFWLNADDRDVPTYLRIFSLRTREEIERLEQVATEHPAAREAQRALARELTTLVHGEAQARAAEDAGLALFGQADLGSLDEPTLAAALAETTVVESDGRATVAELFVATGLTPSLSAARRAVNEGGAYVANVRVEEADAVVPAESFLHGRWLVLRRGRRTVAGVRLAGSPP